MRTLAAHPPRIIHDTEDELTAARLCETLWPGEHITALRKAVEAELQVTVAPFRPRKGQP
jgi:hypothetical protein